MSIVFMFAFSTVNLVFASDSAVATDRVSTVTIITNTVTTGGKSAVEVSSARNGARGTDGADGVSGASGGFSVVRMGDAVSRKYVGGTTDDASVLISTFSSSTEAAWDSMRPLSGATTSLPQSQAVRGVANVEDITESQEALVRFREIIQALYSIRLILTSYVGISL